MENDIETLNKEIDTLKKENKKLKKALRESTQGTKEKRKPSDYALFLKKSMEEFKNDEEFNEKAKQNGWTSKQRNEHIFKETGAKWKRFKEEPKAV